jgi:hypothetical protein
LSCVIGGMIERMRTSLIAQVYRAAYLSEAPN